MSQSQERSKSLLDFNSKKPWNNSDIDVGEGIGVRDVLQNLIKEPEQTPAADRATEILLPSMNILHCLGKTDIKAENLKC